MGLFGRKNKEAEPETPWQPAVADDANWHLWAEKGFESARDSDLPHAVTYWLGAIDRYDEDTTKLLDKLRKDIFDTVIAKMQEGAVQGQLIPSHMIAEVDEPGIPRASIGTREPPTAALFALSGAMIPSGFPFPKVPSLSLPFAEP